MTHEELDACACGEVVPHNPSHIWIEPTTRCNTRCLHCEHYYETFGEDIPPELADRIVADLLGDARRVELIGYGEPFVSKQFDHLFDACVKRGVEIYTTTNGIALRDKELVRRLVEAGVRVCVSIDGARPETFNFVRPGVKWEWMIEALENIKACVAEQTQPTGFSLRINFVPMKANIADLPDIVRLAARYDADEVLTLPLADSKEHAPLRGQQLTEHPELLARYYLEALRLAHQSGVAMGIPPAFRQALWSGPHTGRGLGSRLRRGLYRLRLALDAWKWYDLKEIREKMATLISEQRHPCLQHCDLPWDDTYCAADGKVYACCLVEGPLADLHEESWPEIWNGSAYRNMRRTIHGWNPSAICRYCGLPFGINGGDEKHYKRFFERFTPQPLSLDAPGVAFGEGFSEPDRHEDGTISHYWGQKRGLFEIPHTSGAKVLRVGIIPRGPVDAINPGRARINGGAWEPFDTSCPEIHLPLEGVSGQALRIEYEMENGWRIEADPRELALAVRELTFLT